MGDAKDIQEFLSGRDVVAGKKLSTGDQIITGVAAALPVVSGPMLKTAGKGVKIAGEEVPKVLKTVGKKIAKRTEPVVKKAVKKKGVTTDTAKKLKSKAVKKLKRAGKNKKTSKEFQIKDWSTYPKSLPKPNGPFQILEGDQYNQARNLANKTNANIHKNRPDLKGTQIHEVHPVKFGGSPTDIDNKIALLPKEHAKYTAFWNRVLREKRKGK